MDRPVLKTHKVVTLTIELDGRQVEWIDDALQRAENELARAIRGCPEGGFIFDGISMYEARCRQALIEVFRAAL